eukprot:scaffold171127_cov19-Prasinocladus_malaysianus.AAC.1
MILSLKKPDDLLRVTGDWLRALIMAVRTHWRTPSNLAVGKSFLKYNHFSASRSDRPSLREIRRVNFARSLFLTFTSARLMWTTGWIRAVVLFAPRRVGHHVSTPAQRVILHVGNSKTLSPKSLKPIQDCWICATTGWLADHQPTGRLKMSS